MLGGLRFVVCVILQFHYHDTIPWYIWVLALIAQFVAFGEPAMRSATASKKTCMCDRLRRELARRVPHLLDGPHLRALAQGACIPSSGTSRIESCTPQ